MRLASPKPGFCSCCFQGTDEHSRYVDFEVAFDGAPVLDRESGTIAVLPWNGAQSSHDDLYLCEACVRSATELLGLKPQLNKRQLAEIRRLEIENEHWRAYAKDLEQSLQGRPEPVPSPRRRVKVPA